MAFSFAPILIFLAVGGTEPQPYPQQQPYPYYPPQPYYYPPPPPPPPKPFVPRASGFEAAAFIGFSSAFGAYGDALEPGFHLGGIVGRRLNARFSLGLGIDADRFAPKNSKISQYGFGLSLVPSYYLQFSSGEVILSPRAGVFAIRKSEEALGKAFEQTGTGFSFGGSVTVAFEFKSIRLGPMLTVEHQSLFRICETELGMERCFDPGDFDGSSGNVMFLMLAVWF